MVTLYFRTRLLLMIMKMYKTTKLLTYLLTCTYLLKITLLTTRLTDNDVTDEHQHQYH